MKPLILAVAFVLVLLSGCQECPGGPELEVREVSQPPSSEPMVLDPDEVKREAPVLYDLLEEANQTGAAYTTDKEKHDAVEDYFQKKLGREGHYYDFSGAFVEYRDKIFDIGYNVC